MTLRRSLRLAGQPAPVPAELPSVHRSAVVVGPEVLQLEKLRHYNNYSRYETVYNWPETRAMHDEYVRLAGISEQNMARTRSRNVSADNRAFAQLSGLLELLKPTLVLNEKCAVIERILTFLRLHPELMAAYPAFRKQALQQLDVLVVDLERASHEHHDDETAHAIMNLQSQMPTYTTYIQSMLSRHPLYVTATY